MTEVDNKYDTIVVVHDGKTYIFTGDETEVNCETNTQEDILRDACGHAIMKLTDYGDTFVTVKMRLAKRV